MLNKVNTFNEFPFWNLFTLWKLNLKHQNATFRSYQVQMGETFGAVASSTGVSLSSLMFYDHQSDDIIDGSSLSDLPIVTFDQASSMEGRFIFKTKPTQIGDLLADGVVVPMIFDPMIMNLFEQKFRSIEPISDGDLNMMLRDIPTFISGSLDYDFYQSYFIRVIMNAKQVKMVEKGYDKLINAIHDLKAGTRPDQTKVLNVDTGKYLTPKGTSDLEEYIFVSNAGIDIHVTVSYPKSVNKSIVKSIITEMGGKLTSRTVPNDALRNRVNVNNFNTIATENMLAKIESISKNDVVRRMIQEQRSSVSTKNAFLPVKTNVEVDEEERVSIDEYEEV